MNQPLVPLTVSWPTVITPQTPPVDISATPFEWVDPKTIPPREWVYGRHYIRGFVSATVAASGVGKSSLTMVEALSMVTGRSLLGIEPFEPIKVWLWNEDPRVELQRRVVGAATHYGIGGLDLKGRLFLDSGRDRRLVVCKQSYRGTEVNAPVVEGAIETIVQNGIGCFIVDPFVSTHEVGENDNGAIERVVRAWCDVAERTGCAIELVHHSRKSNGGPVTIEDARGASAWIAATRSARVINVMTEADADRADVEKEERRRYLRVENGKASMARPVDRAEWYFLESVDLGNAVYKRPSDQVGVATTWTWPTVEIAEIDLNTIQAIQVRITTERNRANPQAKDKWVGSVVAEVLNLDSKEDKDIILAHLKKMLESGYLKTGTQKSDKGRLQPIYKIGNWATQPYPSYT